MAVIRANSGHEMQRRLAESVSSFKTSEPFMPISLLVDGHHQAIQFRRQLIGKVAATSPIKTLLGVNSYTKLDLLEEILRVHNSSWTYEAYKTARNQVVQDLLQVTPEKELQKFAGNLKSLQALFSYLDLLDWFDVETLREPQGRVTGLAQTLIDFASQVHGRLSKNQILPIPQLMEQLAADISPSEAQRMSSLLGVTYRVAEQLPQVLCAYLSKVLPVNAYYELEVVIADQNEPKITATFDSAPDPGTEAKVAVNRVANALAKGVSANRIAVLYSDATEYSQHVGVALDDAGIQWHGFAVEEPRASATGRAIRVLIQSFASFVANKAMSRADFLALVRSGRFDHESLEFNNFAVDSFIRRNSFYGGISSWLPILDEMFSKVESLLKAEEEELQYGDEESQKAARRAVTDAETAGMLAKMVRFVLDAFEGLLKQKSLSGLGNGIANLFATLFSDRAFPRTQADLLVAKKIGSSLRTLPDLTGSSLELAEHALASTENLLSRLKLQNGEMSKGVYVGPVSQNGGLEFDVVLVLGCSEGIFPPKMKEHPLLPDSIKRANELYVREAPDIQGRINQLERHFMAITRGANQVHLSHSRGGFIGGASSEGSRFLKNFNLQQQPEIAGTRSFRLISSDPASRMNTATRSILINVAAGKEQPNEATGAALAFAQPTLDGHFGQVDTSVTGKIIDFEAVSLSASTVEKFLNCGHNFYATKVLGFADQDEPDEITDVRAMDIGNILHATFERLLRDFKALTPTFGQPYSQDAKDKFVEILLDEAEKLKAKGLAGWLPKFNDSIAKYVRAVDDIFAIEHKVRVNPGLIKGTPRVADAMAPAQAEFGWHKESGSPFSLDVKAANGDIVTMKFVGYIDRLNRAENNSTLGVLDFKTGDVTYTSTDTRVQDLLYSAAIKAKSPFLGIPVTKVSSIYFVLKPDEPKSVDLRRSLIKEFEGIWLDPSAGGLSGAEYTEALAKVSEIYSEELNVQLAKLADASQQGSFTPKTYAYCTPCQLLGDRVVARLGSLKADNTTEEADDDE